MVSQIKNVVSLKIDHSTLEALKEEARSDRTSLNVLVNNVLQNYMEWEKDAKKAGFIPVTKDMISSIMQKINDNDIEEIVEVTKDIMKAQIIYMEKRYDIQSLMEWIRNWCRMSGFGEKEFFENGILVFIIIHNVGWKWSLYLEKLVKTMLQGLVKRVDCDVSSSMLIFRIAAEQSVKQPVDVCSLPSMT